MSGPGWRWWKRRDSCVDAQRWIVIDCETGGLDAERDELLAIGAVAVRFEHRVLSVVLDDSFEAFLKPAQPSSADNILIHGIGRAAQAQGMAVDQAMRRFNTWVAGAPLIAFHAPFDRAFIERACRRCQVARPSKDWLDLARLAPSLCPDRKLRTLDEWLGAFRLEVDTRHSAASDALATALLLARLVAIGVRQGARDFKALQSIARAERWIA